MGRGTLGEVRDRSGDPRKGPRWVGEISKVQDGLGEHREGAGRLGGTSSRSKTGRGNLGEVRDGLSYLWGVQDDSQDPRNGPGYVGGPSGRSGTGLGTLGEVSDWSEELR